MSFIAAVRRRVSCRTYSADPLEREQIEALKRFLDENGSGPFGSRIRFCLIDADELRENDVKACGTYGVIRGARWFIAGAAEQGPRAWEDYGFAMERNILQATLWGLGTCWLGGTFKRTGFAERIGLAATELLPAVTPVGFAAGKRSVVDRVFRFSAGSDRRKPWETLFFDSRLQALTREAAGSYEVPLECVRLGPSASNKQPWRIIRDGNAFHFYLERTPGYAGNFGGLRLQNVDMGIALCHFLLAAEELGLAGAWVAKKPELAWGAREYICTWQAAM